MLHVILLTMLTAAHANMGSFQPVVRYFTAEEAQLPTSKWDEDSYLSYIKNMAMFPRVSPLSRQEFDKTSINRDGNSFDIAKLGILPPIDMQSGITRDNFQSMVSSYMNLPATNTDFLSLVRDQQAKQSQINAVTYPSTSYGTPIAGSYPQEPPNAQQEVMKLMRELLAKIATQPTPTLAQPPQYEYKLNSPSFHSTATPMMSPSMLHPTIEAHAAQIRDIGATQNYNKQTLHTLKQFDFGPDAHINSNPVKSQNDYQQNLNQFPYSNKKNYQNSFGSLKLPYPTPPSHFYENQHKFNRFNYAPEFESANMEYPSLTYDVVDAFKKPPRKGGPRPRQPFETNDFSTSFNSKESFFRTPKSYDGASHRKPRHHRHSKKKAPPKKAVPQKIVLKIVKS